MEVGGFQELGELDPVVDRTEVVGLVGGVAPEARGLMAGA